MKQIQVEEIPYNVKSNSVFEINSTNVNYFSHGFFKYPCKFIPQIPRWAIQQYSKPEDIVLDPFAGSGTTLVESVLNKRIGLGIDFDKFSQLLCKVKTTKYDKNLINKIKTESNNFKVLAKENRKFMPDLHNLSHWFPTQNISKLSSLLGEIEQYSSDKKCYNFFLVCFASSIRKCSFADDVSPKPYISTRIKKVPLDVKEVFLKNVKSYLKNLEQFESVELGKSNIISNDAREIKNRKFDGKVQLAVTSPPYINAFDYVRSLRLENAWLGYYGDKNILDIKQKQIGTETIYKKDYFEIESTGIKKLDKITDKIFKIDKKRAHIVQKFFFDMSKNMLEIKRLLKNNGHYVIVVGNSTIRGIDVPTNELLLEIAKINGFDLENMFSYVIKNRYLRIPRSGKGGLIKKDWIIDLVK
jgi:DNA modification methylase